MSESEKIIKQVKILCESLPIKNDIICLLNYGSVKIKEDYNNNSDIDFHIVLKKINNETLSDLKNIFNFSEKIDVSIHSIDEIISKNSVIFQNGNQGVYFIHVLASAEVLLGENIYKKLITEIDDKKVTSSVIEKMRYYVWLLRRNYILKNDILVFKKYFIRILKDILILEKSINQTNISTLNSREIVNMFIDRNKDQFSVTEIFLLVNLINLDQIKNPDIENSLVLISDMVNKITWKNI